MGSKKLEKLIEKKVGETFEVAGKRFVVAEREPKDNKPRFFIYEAGSGRYGSSLYLISPDFAIFDLVNKKGKRYYLLDVRFLFSVDLGEDKREARERALSIAKAFSIRERNSKEQKKNSND
jgi:hypothetical protein